MKNISRFLLPFLFVTFIASSASFGGLFSKKPLEIDYLDGSIKMDVKSFFSGDIESFSIVKDSHDKIISTNTAKLNGKWEENRGVLKYDFTYLDGSKDNKIWFITLNSDSTFNIVGHDVAAQFEGKQIGNVAYMDYVLVSRGKNNEQIRTSYEDKMYLVNEKSVILISKLKRSGEDFGTVITSLRKISN